MKTASPKAKENYIFTNRICWIITEGMAGTENQCLAIAESLGFETASIKRIGLKRPYSWVCPFIIKAPSFAAFTGDSLASPFPDIVIASGRKAVSAALRIKKESQGKTFIVQVQDPRIASHHFDLVAVPQHDPTRGDNVIVTTGAPNRITEDKLNEAKDRFADDISALPSRKIAVLIGGNSKAHKMTMDVARALFAKLLPILQTGDTGLMITASRRTPPEVMQYLKERLNTPHCLFWDGTGDNPYFGFLAHADYILVTEDSVSMVSDAATTGKPVYLIPLEGGKKRFDRFKAAFKDKGVIRPFDGSLEHWTYEPLRDADLVAEEIKKRFAMHLQSL